MTAFRDFWYVVAESQELHEAQVLARQVLGESLAVFRDEGGRPAILQDRCLHRAAPLSCGRVVEGCLQCSYHGWTYDGRGCVVGIPSLGPDASRPDPRRARHYGAKEADGYIYVRLADAPADDFPPFRMPHYGEKGFRTLRLINRFRSDVTSCVENFVDIPHTSFVHRGIFRSSRGESVQATVTRGGGSVHVCYRNERNNFGLFSRFLNPSGREILHTDSFHAPNVTSVEYVLGPRRHLIITSQSVPVTDDETLVYTDLTYNYGIWNLVAGPLIRRHGQRIIDQDVEILGRQQEVIRRYGAEFTHSPADVIHVFIESTRNAIADGRDPRQLPREEREIEFWV